ncbi:alpha/beta hydrolase-fold protein [Psychroserpens damuponensis]|uniref:alpha/beta hydrolase-fold protein n=1 Tax=Psychroserpens damuponensis TaxID=943936 RepID=UPI0005912122|nr:alpha/beta hydrolase-fold protein [Psychroserpens damuponensis]
MKINSLIAFLLVTIYSSFAQQYSGTSKTHTLTSKAFEAEREIRVYLPFSYSENKTQEYPVIYLFDGQFDPLFDMTSGTMDYMSQVGEFNQYIIVGIKTTQRAREFTPMYTDKKTQEGWGETKVGEAHILEDHLQNEIFPLIEKTYRIQPFRLAIGHSLGGTFVLNSVLSKPEFFQAVIAISPNLEYDNEQINKRFDTYLKTHDTLKKFIYVSAGTVGGMENNFRKASEKLDHIINYHNPKNLEYHFTVFEGENHSTTPIHTINKGFSEMAKIWTISEEKNEELIKDNTIPFVDDLKSFYSELSKFAGYEVLPSVDEINTFGYDCLYYKKYEDALGVFNWALSLYPDNANLYDSTAEAYLKSGNKNEASRYYSKALEILEKTRDDYDAESYDYYKSMFIKNRDAVEKT